MHKLVFNVFKTIAISMILIFVFDIVFYMYRVASLNQRVESIMTSLQKVVMENNYLTSYDSQLYAQMFNSMIDDYNGAFAASGNQADKFIMHMFWNVGSPAKAADGSNLSESDGSLDIKGSRSFYNGSAWVNRDDVNLVHYTMNEVGSYGDIQCVQLVVQVQQPLWRFANSVRGQRGAPEWNRAIENGSTPFTTEFFYTYYVPCLRYQSVTQ